MANIYTRKSGSDSVVGVRQPMVVPTDRACTFVGLTLICISALLLPGAQQNECMLAPDRSTERGTAESAV